MKHNPFRLALAAALTTLLAAASALHAERIKVADWKLGTPGGVALSAAVVNTLHDDLVTNGIDFAYLHGCKNTTVLDNGDSNFGVLTAGTNIASNGGGSLFLGYSKTTYSLVWESPNDPPYHPDNAIVGKGAVFRRLDDNSTIAVCVFAGAWLNATAKGAGKDMLDAFRNDFATNYPTTRVIWIYSTERVVAQRESTVVSYLSGTANCTEVIRATPLVVYASENVSVTPTFTTFDDPTSGIENATIATLTFGAVTTKDPAVWIDLGSGRAAIDAEAVFSATTQDIDAETVSFT